MDCEWAVSKAFVVNPEKEYINDCCIGCDDVLNQLKSEIAMQMRVDENQIDIYQEDWGWALEFSKNNLFYFLGISNAGEIENKTWFTVQVEANQEVKKFLFTRKVEAANELKQFAEIISKIAKSQGIDVD